MSKKDETRKKIRDTVIELMRDVDFLQITVRMVSEKSGVSRSTFYRYYDSVTDVILEMENEILDYMKTINRMALSDSVSRDSVESTFSRLARSSFLKDHGAFIAQIDGPHGDVSYKNKCIQVMKEYLEGRIRKDQVKPENTDFYLEFMAAGFYHMIHYWVVNRPEVDAEEFEKIQQETFHFFNKYYGIM